MRGAAPDIAWVSEERLHLTLKFLGEQPADRASALEGALAPVAARQAPLTLAMGGLGAFPNLRAPRVVWLGVAPDARLELLQHDVEHGCAALGFALDGRAFRPHVTLGRARTQPAADAARALATAARAVRLALRSDVGSLDLMASELSRDGARYSRLAAMPLGG